VDEQLDFLFFDKIYSAGKVIPKINVGHNNKADYLDYNKNLNLIYLRNTRRNEFSIRPRFKAEKDIQERRIEQNTPPVQPATPVVVEETNLPIEEVQKPVVET